MAEQEKPKRKIRELSPSPSQEEDSSSESDSESSMTTSDEEVDVEIDLEPMDETSVAGGEQGDEKDSDKKSRSGRGARLRREREELSNRERQQRLLNFLLPPWMRIGANRWAAGIASHTSRSSVGPGGVKRRREDNSDEEAASKEPVFERKFFWSCNKESGFPHRVNHAVAGQRCLIIIGRSGYSPGSLMVKKNQTVLWFWVLIHFE